VATAVFFHAHPDDEAIITGGTMARLAAEGHRVVLITATSGELGPVQEGFLRSGETLSTRRESELAEACAVLGVARHEYLGYRDSDMAGEPGNDDPSSFWQADLDEAASRLARLLDSEDATLLTAYDERGGYGHPDHIKVHQVGVRAAELAGTEHFYMATINRDHLVELAAMAKELGAEEVIESLEEGPPPVDELGVPASRITHCVDVSEYLHLKRRAMAAHASQIAETSFFLAMPPEAFSAVWGTEWYIDPRAGRSGPPFEPSLL